MQPAVATSVVAGLESAAIATRTLDAEAEAEDTAEEWQAQEIT